MQIHASSVLEICQGLVKTQKDRLQDFVLVIFYLEFLFQLPFVATKKDAKVYRWDLLPDCVADLLKELPNPAYPEESMTDYDYTEEKVL